MRASRLVSSKLPTTLSLLSWSIRRRNLPARANLQLMVTSPKKNPNQGIEPNHLNSGDKYYAGLKNCPKQADGASRQTNGSKPAKIFKHPEYSRGLLQISRTQIADDTLQPSYWAGRQENLKFPDSSCLLTGPAASRISSTQIAVATLLLSTGPVTKQITANPARVLVYGCRAATTI